MAALEHPHILRVYDFDTDEGVAYLVMEYLAGHTLKKQLHDLDCRGERLALAEVERITGALANALDYAHRQGVVHRDFKPSNIVITANGRPVLTDFGIARMVDATAITESGATLGTPAYMSPEQGKGELGDARSDIYALGVLLYQLCTGRLPFDADTPYAIILKHITAACLLALAVLLLIQLWPSRPGGRLAQPSPTPVLERGRATLVVEGAGAVRDTWLNPDLPDETGHEPDQVHLQGPLTPDRFLLRFELPGLPAGARLISATLTLRVELWGKESFPGAAVVYRVLVPWEAATATFNKPWSTPGLAAGVDYDPTPLDLGVVPDAGWLTLDVSRAIQAWYVQGQPN